MSGRFVLCFRLRPNLYTSLLGFGEVPLGFVAASQKWFDYFLRLRCLISYRDFWHHLSILIGGRVGFSNGGEFGRIHFTSTRVPWLSLVLPAARCFCTRLADQFWISSTSTWVHWLPWVCDLTWDFLGSNQLKGRMFCYFSNRLENQKPVLVRSASRV